MAHPSRTGKIPHQRLPRERRFGPVARLQPGKIFSSAFQLPALLCILLFLPGCATRPGTGVRKTSTTFTTVVLDAGHGGHDSGARSRKGLLEKDVALDVVRRLAPKLRAAGFRTILTRSTDAFIPLDRRVQISDREDPAVFVSVHFNDAGRRQIAGMESYYFSAESRRFSQRLVEALAEATGAANRGAREARFRVLRCNLNPAVLVECGYLSSRREAGLIAQPDYRERIATGLAAAIIKQRGGPLPASGTGPAIPRSSASLGDAPSLFSAEACTALVRPQRARDGASPLSSEF